MTERNDNEVGNLCGGIVDKPSTEKMVGVYAEFENVYTEKEFQGKDPGRQLIGNFIVWCKENSASVVSATASAQNSHVIDLCRKMGYIDHDVTLEMHI